MINTIDRLLASSIASCSASPWTTLLSAAARLKDLAAIRGADTIAVSRPSCSTRGRFNTNVTSTPAANAPAMAAVCHARSGQRGRPATRGAWLSSLASACSSAIRCVSIRCHSAFTSGSTSGLPACPAALGPVLPTAPSECSSDSAKPAAGSCDSSWPSALRLARRSSTICIKSGEACTARSTSAASAAPSLPSIHSLRRGSSGVIVEVGGGLLKYAMTITGISKVVNQLTQSHTTAVQAAANGAHWNVECLGNLLVCCPLHVAEHNGLPLPLVELVER